MATSTIWRLNVSANNGGDLLGIAEMQFRTAVGSPLEFTDFDAVNASTGLSTCVKVMDGDDEGVWYSTYPANTGWWEYTYTSPVEIKSYVIQAAYPDGSYATYAPKDWTLEYWDGAAWQVADTKTNITNWTTHECREFTVGSGSGTFTTVRGMFHESSNSWRLNITAVNGGSQIKINRVQMRKMVGVSAPAWDTPPYASASASSEATTNNSDNAVANTSSNYWITASSVTSAYLQLDYDWPITVRQYQFYAFDSGSQPTAFTLEYWDGSAWVVADTQSGVSGSPQTYTVTMTSGGTTNDGEVTWPEMTVTAPFEPLAWLPFTTTGGTVLQAAIYTGAVNLGDPNAFGGAFAATPFTVAATAILAPAYHGAAVWPQATVSGALEGALPLPLLTVSGTGFAGNVGSGDIDWPLCDLAGGMEDAHALPLWQVAAYGENGSVGQGDAVLAQLALDGSLEPPLAWPEWTLDGLAQAGTVASGNALWPALDADAVLLPQVQLNWPQLTLAATAFNGAVAQGNVAWPKATASGVLAQDGSGVGQATLQGLTVSGVLVSDTLASGGVVLGQWSVTASAATGTTGSGNATLTLPLLAVSASGYMDAVGTADVVLPLLQVAASGDSTAVAAPVFTTLTLNTRTQAMARHTNLAFNSLTRFAGLTLAATPQGIVALLGDTDHGAPIAAQVTSGLSDLGSEQLKRVLCGYVGYRAAGSMDLTLVTDQHHEYVYRLDPRQDAADLHASRVKTGRGVDGRYWQWTLANTDGQAFELDRLTFDATKLSRRA